jgi:5-(hydroxymethyl)furfural/furfural oxidase
MGMGMDTNIVAGRRIVVSCGALGSPVVLMRSGIGPAAHLRARGIAVTIDRPGIGENLQEHPAIGLSAFLSPGARLQRGIHYHLQSLLRWSSGLPGAPAGDMHAAVSTRSGWHEVGWRIGTLYGWVNKSYSKGRVRLGEDPAGRPDIDFRMLSDPRDLTRLMASFRLSHRILSDAAAAGAVQDIFPTSYSARIKQLMRPGLRNGAVMSVAGPLMDASPALRRRLLAHAIEGGEPVETLVADDAALEAHLRRMAGGVWHPCGTCRMGDPADPMAVADPAGQVIGADGLMVCDASLMPTIPCANLNIPVLMSAEKIADGMRA